MIDMEHAGTEKSVERQTPGYRLEEMKMGRFRDRGLKI